MALIVAVYLLLACYRLGALGTWIDEAQASLDRPYRGFTLFRDGTGRPVLGAQRWSSLRLPLGRTELVVGDMFALSVQTERAVFPLLVQPYGTAYPALIARLLESPFGLLASDHVVRHRLSQVLFGALALCLVYVLSVRFLPYRPAAVLATAITATNPLFLSIFRLSVPDEGFPLLALLFGLWLALRALDTHRRAWIVAAAASLALAVSVKLTYAVPIAAGLAAFRLVAPRELRSAAELVDGRTALAIAGALLCVFSPFLLLLVAPEGARLFLHVALDALPDSPWHAVRGAVSSLARQALEAVRWMGPQDTFASLLSLEPVRTGPGFFIAAVVAVALAAYLALAARVASNRFHRFVTAYVLLVMPLQALLYWRRQLAVQLLFQVMVPVFMGLALMIRAADRTLLRARVRPAMRIAVSVVLAGGILAFQTGAYARLVLPERLGGPTVRNPVFSARFDRELAALSEAVPVGEQVLLLPKDLFGVVDYVTDGRVRPIHVIVEGQRAGASGANGPLAPDCSIFAGLLSLLRPAVVVLPENDRYWRWFSMEPVDLLAQHECVLWAATSARMRLVRTVALRCAADEPCARALLFSKGGPRGADAGKALPP